MKEAGLGGFFMHSRYGLKTPYLSEEWFTCIRACIEKARALDMKAYLYDEDRWPSGFAGGVVTRDNPEYRAKRLEKAGPETPGEDAVQIAAFALEFDNAGFLVSYTDLNHMAAPEGSHVECYYQREHPVIDRPDACKLAIEVPRNFKIGVNGQAATNVDGWWLDEDLRPYRPQQQPARRVVLLRRTSVATAEASGTLSDRRDPLALEGTHNVTDFLVA